MSIAETAQLAVNLKLGTTGSFAGATSQLNNLERAATRAGTSASSNLSRTFSKVGKDIETGIGKSIRNLERLGVVAGGLAIGGGAAVVKWAGDFQAQLNTINTIAFATPDALSKIGDGIRDIAKKTGLSLDDLTASYYDLLSAGVKTADAQSVLNNAVTLGIGGLATTQQTVDLLTTAYNVYGLTAAGATKATDQFAQAIADGKVHADQIAASFANVASLAKTYGIGIDQIAASFGYLTAQGHPAAEVTTEMQRAIISLIKPLPELEAAQKKLKIIFTDEIRKKGLVPALQELRTYADANKIPLITLLGRVEAVKYALAVTGPGFNAFQAELTRINSSAGMAAKQAAERQQGFNFQIARLTANIKDAGITIGSALLPPLGDLADKFTSFLHDNQDGIKAFGKDLAEALRGGVEWASKLDFHAIAEDLKAAGGFAKGIISAFLAAPSWLQEAVVTGWGLNKLTGGALVNVFGDLTKGLVSGVTKSIGMSFATAGIGKLFVQPVFVTNPGFGSGGGGVPVPGGGGGLLPIVGTVLTKLAGLGLLVGGTALLSNGVQTGGPIGAAEGAGGAALGIGGAALLLGPLGAIAASVGLTAKTLLDIRGQSASQATDIATLVGQEIAGGANLADLQKALDGVNQGINDIQANPLNVLVAGDALDNLRAQRAALLHQIGLQTDSRSEAAATRRVIEAQYEQDKSSDSRAEGARTRQLNATISTAAAGTASAAAIKANAASINAEFRKITDAVRNSRGDISIAKALKAALSEIFGKGKGGSGGAQNVLAALRVDLKETHDPKLQAALREAIGRVEHIIPVRQFVEAQVNKANQIVKSTGLTNAQKITALQHVEEAIGSRNRIATAQVQAKIDALKKAQVAAANATTQAVKDQRLQITLNNILSLRGLTTLTSRDTRYYRNGIGI